MPNLGDRKLNLSESRAKTRQRSAESKGTKGTRGSPAPPPTKRKKSSEQVLRGRQVEPDYDDDDDYDEDGDDDEIIASSNDTKSSSNKILFGACGAVVVIVIVALFLILRSGRSNRDVDEAGEIDPIQVEETDTSAGSGGQTPGVGNEVEIETDPSVGTQDFRQDTNNISDSPLTNPDAFVEDIYGLTSRVDYEVAQIQNIADFVSYTKHRGTWGGGLELYYLDVVYKEAKYVIQVPFKYYKELDDVGIIPVKMEVLRIRNETGDGYLTVISYMCLDEDTLETVLKTQTR